MFAHVGITLLSLFTLGLLLGIVLLDLFFESRHYRPLGQLVANWSRRYPLFSAGLALVFGALLSHFFWPPP